MKKLSAKIRKYTIQEFQWLKSGSNQVGSGHQNDFNPLTGLIIQKDRY